MGLLTRSTRTDGPSCSRDLDLLFRGPSERSHEHGRSLAGRVRDRRTFLNREAAMTAVEVRGKGVRLVIGRARSFVPSPERRRNYANASSECCSVGSLGLVSLGCGAADTGSVRAIHERRRDGRQHCGRVRPSATAWPCILPVPERVQRLAVAIDMYVDYVLSCSKMTRMSLFAESFMFPPDLDAPDGSRDPGLGPRHRATTLGGTSTSPLEVEMRERCVSGRTGTRHFPTDRVSTRCRLTCGFRTTPHLPPPSGTL
jgi:hypothetical protein